MRLDLNKSSPYLAISQNVPQDRYYALSFEGVIKDYGPVSDSPVEAVLKRPSTIIHQLLEGCSWATPVKLCASNHDVDSRVVT